MKLCVTVHKLPKIKVSGRLEEKPTAVYSVTNTASGVITLRLFLQSELSICKIYKNAAVAGWNITEYTTRHHC